MMSSHAPIFLLTDFGLRDPYVGIMKGVILSLGYTGTMVDLTHGIPPQDVLAGAMALEDAWPHLPATCVIVAVVDPGVGTRRRPIAVRNGGRVLVGPDNGLLSPLFPEIHTEEDARQVIEIRPGGPIDPSRSTTFHGRDVFSPAAALLATGARSFEALGEPADDPVMLPEHCFRAKALPSGAMELTILAADHFGNLTMNVRRSAGNPHRLYEFGRYEVAGRTIRNLSATYADVPAGEPLVYFNAADRLEIAVNGGSAAQVLRARPGDKVLFTPEPRTP